MKNRTLREIIDVYLERDDRSLSYLARQLGRLPDQLGRWLNGANQIPYHIVGELARILRMTPVEQVELYAAAGYPLPGWAADYGEHMPTASSGPRGPEPEDALAVRRLSSSLHYAEYLQQRLRKARHSVEERRAGIEETTLTPDEAQAYRACTETILELCRRRVVYRALTATGDDLLLQAATAAHGEGLRTYNVRTLAPPLRQRMHLLDFVIIDGKEALLALHHHAALPADREIRLAVRHPDIIAMFRAYFDTAWASGHVIKEGDELQRRRFGATRRSARAAAD